MSCFYEHKFSLSLFEESSIPFPPALKQAVRKRRAEFLAGRILVNQAFAQLGYGVTPDIKVGRNREPIWPPGIFGSISHTTDTVCCALSNREGCGGIGIDVETYLEDHDARNFASLVVNTKEYKMYSNKSVGLCFGQWMTLVFSAKESLFKALYPTVQCYFNFLDVEMFSLDFYRQELTLAILKDLAPNIIKGTYYCVNFKLEGNQVITFLNV